MYGYNNPLKFVDPSGLRATTSGPVTGGLNRLKPMNASRGYFEVAMADYPTVKAVAKAIDVDPILLLIVYRKERSGWQRNQNSTVRDIADTLKPGEGDVGSSMGVTNLQFPIFKSIYRKHTGELGQFGMKTGLSDSQLRTRWFEIENPDSKGLDVRLSLAMTGLHLRDRLASLSVAKGIDAVQGVTYSEWAAVSYRFSLGRTVLPIARGQDPLGPNVASEIAHFRIQYAALAGG